MAETSAQRAASVKEVVAATANEDPAVKAAALEAITPPIQPPSRTTTDVVWLILVSGLVLLLILALLALAHVIGSGVSDDKVVTIFTTVLAGLLGLFVKSPAERNPAPAGGGGAGGGGA